MSQNTHIYVDDDQEDEDDQEDDDDEVEILKVVSMAPPTGIVAQPQSEDESTTSISSSSAIATLTKHLDLREENSLLTAFELLRSDVFSSGLPRSNISQALYTLLRCFNNVLEHPEDQKFRCLAISKPAFTAKLTEVLPSSIDVLLSTGWTYVTDPETKKSTLMLTNEDYNKETFRYVQQNIKQLMEDLREVVTDNPIYQKKSSSSSSSQNKNKMQIVAVRQPTQRLSREDLAKRAEQRLKGEPTNQPETSSSTVRRGRVMNLEQYRRVRNEINAMRHDKHTEAMKGRKRFFTLSDVTEMQKQEHQARAKFGSNAGIDPEWIEIGKQALQYTNEFRAQHGLQALEWHQSLCEIGYVHSVDMGEGRVPFDHVGFDKRVRQYPFPVQSAAENLAMNYGVAQSEVARVAVDGWIDSPGHCRNLLSRQHWCGIGVYRTFEGKYYLTQLFGL